MAVLPDNLTTLVLEDDASLLARFPTINQYLPAGQNDWTPQRDAAQIEALETFWALTGSDPLWCRAENASHWQTILGLFTLVVIFRGFLPHEAWVGESERWASIAEQKLKIFRYVEDTDQDGTITAEETEAITTISSLELIR